MISWPVSFKGRVTLPNQMNFWKSSKGGGGSFQILDLYKGIFRMFSEKNAISLSENEGGWGSKAVWNLSENLSNLEAWPVPTWALNSWVSSAFGNFFLKISFIVSAVYPYQSGAAQPTCSSRLSFQPRVLISFWQLGLPSIFQSIILSIQQGFHRHLILINLRMKKIWTFTGTCMWRKLCTLNRHVSQTNFKTCKCTGDHPEQPGRRAFEWKPCPPEV